MLVEVKIPDGYSYVNYGPVTNNGDSWCDLIPIGSKIMPTVKNFIIGRDAILLKKNDVLLPNWIKPKHWLYWNGSEWMLGVDKPHRESVIYKSSSGSKCHRLFGVDNDGELDKLPKGCYQQTANKAVIDYNANVVDGFVVDRVGIPAIGDHYTYFGIENALYKRSEHTSDSDYDHVLVLKHKFVWPVCIKKGTWAFKQSNGKWLFSREKPVAKGNNYYVESGTVWDSSLFEDGVIEWPSGNVTIMQKV